MSEGIEEKRRFRIAFEYEEQRLRLEQMGERNATLMLDVSSAKEQLRSLPSMEDDTTRKLMQLQSGLAAPAEAAVALHEEESTLKRQVSRDEAQLEGVGKQLNVLNATLRKLEREKGARKVRWRSLRLAEISVRSLLTIFVKKRRISHD
ncbi:hypothetical protein ERJ75_000031100 [Trypanosoma vivax]|nr:hypothetical protein ERJ75_000031100 [Trypanosoma vivax]